ncbi:hypothetical protein [Deinococcus radiophilus]|uniref:Uncharacterized protein n=1 Tax=Deinococcus radiophilus TaxID=32062 RepID=A0A431VK29_9DEIO|nr:hypothetical protein [Deinococcus radiophilus]RTR22359.1 hypothetical protein EJ104_12775 [Deinococcus radiophilus]UFA49999.1 hypothetical protein LMT64_08920 [Deinococcus radiophilus]
MARQGTRFEKARFHIATGPASLFERVRFKMQGRRQLKWHAQHLRERSAERQAPLEKLANFDTATWELLTAEVRADTGKFVNSCWAVTVGGERWLVVIGFGDTVETVFRSTKQGLGEGIVRSGPLYDRVAAVNSALMAAESGI